MKKFAMLMLCLVLVFALAACAGTDTTPQGSVSDTVTVTDMKGEVAIPANPQRIVDVAGLTEELLILDPFWSIWLKHLMSRPSCYKCPFATTERVADISLGDLWGVHLYCPELYGKNGGASLAVANTDKGRTVLQAAEAEMYGHELKFEECRGWEGGNTPASQYRQAERRLL